MIKLCKDVEIQCYEHCCSLKLPYKENAWASVDKCLANEIVELWYIHNVKTLGCCCGHDKLQGYVQVEPQYCEKMIELGYEQLPLDKNGNGLWCFKPKSKLKYKEEY